MAEQVTRLRDASSDTRARVSVLESQVVSIAHNIEKLETKVEGQYNTLHSRISDLRDDIQLAIDQKNERIMEKLDEQSAEAADAHKSLSERLGDIEKWRWILIGAAAVIGYILAHVRIEKFF